MIKIGIITNNDILVEKYINILLKEKLIKTPSKYIFYNNTKEFLNTPIQIEKIDNFNVNNLNGIVVLIDTKEDTTKIVNINIQTAISKLPLLVLIDNYESLNLPKEKISRYLDLSTNNRKLKNFLSNYFDYKVDILSDESFELFLDKIFKEIYRKISKLDYKSIIKMICKKEYFIKNSKYNFSKIYKEAQKVILKEKKIDNTIINCLEDDYQQEYKKILIAHRQAIKNKKLKQQKKQFYYKMFKFGSILFLLGSGVLFYFYNLDKEYKSIISGNGNYFIKIKKIDNFLNTHLYKYKEVELLNLKDSLQEKLLHQIDTKIDEINSLDIPISQKIDKLQLLYEKYHTNNLKIAIKENQEIAKTNIWVISSLECLKNCYFNDVDRIDKLINQNIIKTKQVKNLTFQLLERKNKLLEDLKNLSKLKTANIEEIKPITNNLNFYTQAKPYIIKNIDLLNKNFELNKWKYIVKNLDIDKIVEFLKLKKEFSEFLKNPRLKNLSFVNELNKENKKIIFEKLDNFLYSKFNLPDNFDEQLKAINNILNFSFEIKEIGYNFHLAQSKKETLLDKKEFLNNTTKKWIENANNILANSDKIQEIDAILSKQKLTNLITTNLTKKLLDKKKLIQKITQTENFYQLKKFSNNPYFLSLNNIIDKKLISFNKHPEFESQKFNEILKLPIDKKIDKMEDYFLLQDKYYTFLNTIDKTPITKLQHLSFDLFFQVSNKQEIIERITKLLDREVSHLLMKTPPLNKTKTYLDKLYFFKNFNIKYINFVYHNNNLDNVILKYETRYKILQYIAKKGVNVTISIKKFAPNEIGFECHTFFSPYSDNIDLILNGTHFSYKNATKCKNDTTTFYNMFNLKAGLLNIKIKKNSIIDTKKQYQKKISLGDLFYLYKAGKLAKNISGISIIFYKK